ncbi:MAG TPA: hypothetical protein VK072_05715 [Candidatus Avamphibacillus sp.]|nr:hypothetical protein [Candidatus Avamphibacillus sp.]
MKRIGSILSFLLFGFVAGYILSSILNNHGFKTDTILSAAIIILFIVIVTVFFNKLSTKIKRRSD